MKYVLVILVTALILLIVRFLIGVFDRVIQRVNDLEFRIRKLEISGKRKESITNENK